MNTYTRSSFVLLVIGTTMITGFAQDTDKVEKKKDATKEERTDGLRRITPQRHWDFDFDDEKLEANIERAVEHAMKSVEVAMERVEINLKHLHIEPVEVHIPDIDIEPIDIRIPAIDIDIDHHFHHRDWDDDSEKNHKSDKVDKEKTKGLKKIN